MVKFTKAEKAVIIPHMVESICKMSDNDIMNKTVHIDVEQPDGNIVKPPSGAAIVYIDVYNHKNVPVHVVLGDTGIRMYIIEAEAEYGVDRGSASTWEVPSPIDTVSIKIPSSVILTDCVYRLKRLLRTGVI